MVDKVAVGRVFRGVLLFSLVSVIPSMLHLHLHVAYQKDKRTKLENSTESTAVCEIGEHCVEKHFHFVLGNNRYLF